MKPKELLQLAKTDFKKDFGKTHKEKGYHFVFPWKKSIVFAHNKQEAIAYIKSQRIINATVIIAIITCLILAICYACDVSMQIFYILGMVGILFEATLIGLHINCVKICKDKVLIYEQD